MKLFIESSEIDKRRDKMPNAVFSGGPSAQREDRPLYNLLGLKLDTAAKDERPQNMAMTMHLILCAVTHEGDISFARKVLDQAQRELLPVVLYEFISLVYLTTKQQLLLVFALEGTPGDIAALHPSQEALTWT